jgi:hypothetical protein
MRVHPLDRETGLKWRQIFAYGLNGDDKWHVSDYEEC